jgi:mono/diheme cytochrome c family protein
MRGKNILATSAAVLMLLAGSGASFGQESHVGKMIGKENRGKALYQRYCIFCHGKYGDGRGDSAPYIDPKPRDFTLGAFKCRSTPSGSLPLDSDLFDTISRGIHSSGMPSWKPLTRQERVDLVAYVRSFSAKFTEEKPGAVVQIPPEPPTSPESVKRGADLFQSMNCVFCHGKEGRGDGPSAATLTDNKGNPIRPFDLTSGTHLKCGDSDQGIFRDLSTGLDGTPMPSFTDALKPDQMWDIVHYLATVRTAGKGDRKQASIEPIAK